MVSHGLLTQEVEGELPIVTPVERGNHIVINNRIWVMCPGKTLILTMHEMPALHHCSLQLVPQTYYTFQNTRLYWTPPVAVAAELKLACAHLHVTSVGQPTNKKLLEQHVVSVTTTGSMVWTANEHGILSVWSANNIQIARLAHERRQPVTHMWANAHRVYVVWECVVVFDAQSFLEIAVLDNFQQPWCAVEHGFYVYVSDRWASCIRIFDTRTWKQVPAVDPLTVGYPKALAVVGDFLYCTPYTSEGWYVSALHLGGENNVCYQTMGEEVHAITGNEDVLVLLLNEHIETRRRLDLSLISRESHTDVDSVWLDKDCLYLAGAKGVEMRLLQ